MSSSSSRCHVCSRRRQSWPSKPSLPCSDLDHVLSFAVGYPKDIFVVFLSSTKLFTILLKKSTFRLRRWCVVSVRLMSRILNHIVIWARCSTAILVFSPQVTCFCLLRCFSSYGKLPWPVQFFSWSQRRIGVRCFY